jgi:hypothetical protein
VQVAAFRNMRYVKGKAAIEARKKADEDGCDKILVDKRNLTAIYCEALEEMKTRCS